MLAPVQSIGEFKMMTMEPAERAAAYAEQERIRIENQKRTRAKRILFVKALAVELGATVDPIEHENDAWGHRITLEGRKMFLRFDRNGISDTSPDRIEISGSWPSYTLPGGGPRICTPRDCGAISYNSKSPEISCNPERGANAIAKDMRRRFLPEFERLYDKCVAWCANTGAAYTAAIDRANAIAREFGGDVRHDGNNVTLYAAGQMLIVSVYGAGQESVRFERSIDGLSVAQAVAILRIIADGKAS